MQIQLSGKAADIVKEQVASGFYGSTTEFISDIVLRADEFNRLKLERLRREVNIGFEEIKRGEVVEFDLEDILNENVNAKPKKPIKAGSAKGLIKVADDFDKPLDDFQEYMQ